MSLRGGEGGGGRVRIRRVYLNNQRGGTNTGLVKTDGIKVAATTPPTCGKISRVVYTIH